MLVCLRFGHVGLCWVVLGHDRFGRVCLFYDWLRWFVLGYLGWVVFVDVGLFWLS